MIRPITAADADAVLEVAAAIGFEPDELEHLRGTVAAALDGTHGEHHTWVCLDEGDGPIGVAYFAPEEMSRGTWNLILLAVRPEAHGRGHGKALVRFVEETLREGGERMLLIETSSGDDFAPARAFYARLGYEQEATIRDFYEPGDDKIVFRKLL